MANTTIQIKRSSSTATPTDGSLSAGELAYSYNSDRLFLGTANGAKVLEVGGRYWLDTIKNAYDTANTGGSGTVAAFNTANGAFYHANAAYDKANSANVLAYNALPQSGGTISGDLGITGNLTVSGNVTFINTQVLEVGDNIIVLNADLDQSTTPTEDAGIEINRGSQANVSVKWNETSETWTLTNDGVSWYDIAVNTDITSVGHAANSWANTVGTAGNNYTNAVGVAGNNYTNSVGVAGNNYTNAVGVAGNNYTNAVGTAGNNYTDAVGTAGNNYTVAVGAAANNYANASFYTIANGSAAFGHANAAYDKANNAVDKGFVLLSNSSTKLDGATGNIWGGSFSSSLRDTWAGVYNANNSTALFTFASGSSNVMSVQTDGSLFVGENFVTDALGVLPSYGGWIVAASGIKSAYNISAEVDISAGANVSAGNVIVSKYIQFSDGSKQYIANAPSIVSQGAFYHANAAYDKANSANVLAYNTGIGANAYAESVGTAGNNYTNAVGVAGNNYTNAVGVAGNNYTNSVGEAANNYASATYLNKTTGGTVTGDLSITGNVFITKELNVTGNVTFTNTSTLVVSDPLIYLANNNYQSDIVDIGFVGNYNNGSANLHTGLYREHATKEYFLFQGYTEEPYNNHIDHTANGFQLAVLNTDLITSNLVLGGVNAIPWIASAYDKANSANVLAYNTGIGANAYAEAIGTAGNNYTNAVGVAGNNYTNAVGVAGNNYTNAVGTAGNNYTNAVGVSGNNYTDAVGTAGNNYMLSVATAGNNYMLTVATAGNNYTNFVGGLANTNAANASYINTGTLAVLYGGTGLSSVTANGILYGDGTNALKVTSSGTDGQVLQSDQGVPKFAMLDGGSF